MSYNILYDKLKKYSTSKVIPMHMPGHKRNGFIFHNKLPYNIDITEIDGFDNLHKANGIIKDSEISAQNLYKSEKSFYLVNGSTCGILAGIRSAVNFNDEVLVSRNCHKSVYNAIELLNLRPTFIMPTIDKFSGIFNSITPYQIESKLKQNENIKLVILTSPTYEGVISNIKEIAKICHRKNIPLLVDEAHGAHLFLENKSSVINGADIVINSLHKTLPSLTQTAIMHVNGEIINPNRVEEELNVFETSSPSYVLLSSIDSCINLLSKKGSKLYNNYLKKLSYFDKKISVLKNLVVINHSDKIKHNGFYDFDKGKIVISTSLANLSGNDLMKLLRYEKIECEMCYTNYVIAMTSIFDSMKNIKILAKKLIKIDKTLEKQEKNNNFREILPKIKYTSFEVRDKESESIKLDSSIDKISKEYVYAYPPGIPLIVPGEVISKEFVKYVNNINQNGVILNSTYNDLPTNITIIK